MTSGRNSSNKPNKETPEQKKERLAAERKARLAAQLPKVSLSGFTSAPVSAATSPAPPVEFSAPSGQQGMAEVGEEPLSFSGFTVDVDDTPSSAAESPMGEPMVPSQQASPADAEFAVVEAATSSAPANHQDRTAATDRSGSPTVSSPPVTSPADPEVHVSTGEERTEASVPADGLEGKTVARRARHGWYNLIEVSGQTPPRPRRRFLRILRSPTVLRSLTARNRVELGMKLPPHSRGRASCHVGNGGRVLNASTRANVPPAERKRCVSCRLPRRAIRRYSSPIE